LASKNSTSAAEKASCPTDKPVPKAKTPTNQAPIPKANWLIFSGARFLSAATIRDSSAIFQPKLAGKLVRTYFPAQLSNAAISGCPQSQKTGPS
jgi:hypothetical protein